ncbi:MAG: hypothetical protein JSV88_03445 [Candidatus Aminicenantes bacterium]|nr:MAG: hypothetical protein JSV88_03445 [Candidatus Aminicenantes bacterium]
MIIENGIVKSKSPDVNYYENQEFQVYFQGVIYIPYIKSGIESIKKILTGIKNNKINNTADIRGHFFIFIINKTNNYKYFFIDNTGIFKAFIHENVISNSLLELARYLNFDRSKLNFNAIVGFLHFGFIYFDHTFFENISRIDKNKIIASNQNHEQIIEDKGLEKINQPIDLDIIDFFKGFYEAVKEKKISFDLTGGTDSRLLVSLMTYLNADFELAVSGIKGHKDIEIARDISHVLKKDFFVSYHNIEDITDEFLKDFFYLTDAQIDLVSYHRKHQLILQRKERGIDVQINGAGGSLYKDYWWLQDFPFYHKKRGNIEKLYDLRFEPLIYPHDQLGDQTKLISQNLRDNTIKKLYEYQAETNTQTYDNVSYNYKDQGSKGTFVTIGSQILDTYAPLLELDLVRFGFGLKRRKRFFNNFHREIISTYCPIISKIKTNEGVTCSSKISDKLKDLVGYMLDKQKRLTKQILRKILKKTYFQESPTDPGIFKKVAGLDIFKNQIPLLKEYGIINKDLKIEDMRDNDIGKFLVIGLLLRELE